MLDTRLRDRYALPPDPEAVELRAFTHGLMPRTVPEMMERFVDDWRRLGVDAWNHIPNHWLPDDPEPIGWWSLPVYLADRFVAPLLGTDEGTCILQPNVHWVVQALLSAPEIPARGTEIVVTDGEFPSVLHSVQRWESLTGVRPRIVPRTPDGRVDEAAVLDAIGPDTALVILSHVGFSSGERLTDDFLARVRARTRAADALFALDGYHATASLAVDVRAYGVDLYFGGLLKEASGSSGNAYVYVRPGIDLTPRLTGWFGDADPFGFGPAPEAHPDVRRRFLGGTTGVASLYHAVEGVRILLDAGLDAVRRDSLAKTARCLDRADALDLPVVSPRAPERRGALVVLKTPDADRLCAHLKTQGIYTDSRKGRLLRMAPFVWNTLDEIDRTFDAIGEAMRAGGYRAQERAAAGPVT